MADVQQAHETLVIVVSQALGGKASSSTSQEQYAKNEDDLERRLMRALG